MLFLLKRSWWALLRCGVLAFLSLPFAVSALVPTNMAMDPADDAGASNADATTWITTPRFTWTAPDGVVVRYAWAITLSTGNPFAAGNVGRLQQGSVTTTNARSTALAEGNYKFWIQVVGPGASDFGSWTSLNFSIIAQFPRATVNWNEVHQVIDGFGASSAYHRPLSDSQADLFFSADLGIGLSLLRTRIAPDGTTMESIPMQKAQARGARVWSTPWSPPAAWKDNNDINNGGHLLAAHYQDYANQLATYVLEMSKAGVPLLAVSIQNEAANATTYESCVWSDQNIHDFVPLLYDALVARGVSGTKILLPEHSHWKFDLAAATLADPATAAKVGIYGGHNYGSEPAAPVNTAGRPLWMTELCQHVPTTVTYWGENIHSFLATAEVNAYNYWWLVPSGDDYEGLLDLAGNPTKRVYALGQFSKFIRPGYYRIGVTSSSNLLVSAYKQPVTGKFVIVAVNPTNESPTTAFTLTGLNPASVIPWVTSDTASLAVQPAVAVTGSQFSYPIPANSIVTFVGEVTAAQATLAPAVTTSPASATAAAGSTLTLTAGASGTAPSYQWTKNGATIAGATSAALTFSDLQPAQAGLYQAAATNAAGGAASAVAIVGPTTTSKVIGTGTEVVADVVFANGNIFDQVLLQGAAASVTADPGQIVRISFIDFSDDIVQLEFSGAGTLSLLLDGANGPAAPVNYNQTVTYMKGHAGVVVTGANESTNLSVFSVGRNNAVNQALFRSDVTYDGLADIAFVAISSANGKFGGLRTANASYWATRGLTGVFAPGVEFLGPVFIGDIDASGTATPTLVIGSGPDVRITGGNLLQTNNRSVQVRGLTQLQFANGSTSHGALLAAKANQGRLEENDREVTARIVVGP